MEHMRESDRVNILLVDDQPSKLLTYNAILAELNENLITAGSARDALQHLLKTEIAVVLVDVCMPDLDGFELVSMMREHPRFEKTAIIFVSGVLQSDLDRLKGYQVGAVDYVSVPVVPEILRAKVGVFADLYRKTRQLERLNQELERRVAERTADLEASTARLRESEERLKLALEEARDADRRKDEFLAILSHELRNPLAPIRTAAEMLRTENLTPERREKTREVIERQVDHLVRLIDDLMDVSRISRGVITLRQEPVDLSSVVSHAVETHRALLDARSQQLSLELPERGPLVLGDPTRLSQVVGNLLNNAAKYTGTNGRVSVLLGTEGPDAVLRVKDNGVGIPPHMLSKVFELFTQVKRDQDRAPGGLGIGLAIVRRLVERHGGVVRASSAGPGKGTEVIVRLPRMIEEPDLASPVRQPDPEHTDTRRVLVVDDNEDAASALAELLELEGHESRTASDGLEAIQIAEEWRPDVVLLDLGMPRIDGYEAARRIRAQPWGKEMGLVALTGWGQRQDRERTAACGFDAHLVKPIRIEALLEILARVTSEAPSDVRRSG